MGTYDCWGYVGNIHAGGLNFLDPLLNLRRICWRGFVQRGVIGRRDGCHLDWQVILVHLNKITNKLDGRTIGQSWGTWNKSTWGCAGSERMSGLRRCVGDNGREGDGI